MEYFALIYFLADDYLSRRGVLRDGHLQLRERSPWQRRLVLAGAFSDPADSALLIFHVKDKAVIESFIQNDPYVKNGLVTRWEIRPWSVAVGR